MSNLVILLCFLIDCIHKKIFFGSRKVLVNVVCVNRPYSHKTDKASTETAAAVPFSNGILQLKVTL